MKDKKITVIKRDIRANIHLGENQWRDSEPEDDERDEPESDIFKCEICGRPLDDEDDDVYCSRCQKGNRKNGRR